MNDNILVVDDERDIADLIEVYLQNENYTVFKYYSAREALACVETTGLDLALRHKTVVSAADGCVKRGQLSAPF